MIIFEDSKAASTSDLHSDSLSQNIASLRNGHKRQPTDSPDWPQNSLRPPPYAHSASGSRNALSVSSLSLLSTVSLPSTVASAPGSSPSSSRVPFIQRSNHLYITRPVGPIKGTWLIDTSLRLPPAMLPPIEEGTTRKNLRFHAKMGKVSARVEVKAAPPYGTTPPGSPSVSGDDGRAHLFFRSETSDVKVRLRRNGIPRLNVMCVAPVGSVIIYLPYDYQGPVRTTSTTGVSSLFLSPAILKQCTQIVPGSPSNSHSRRCVHFIGNCPGPEETWDRFDEVDIEAKRGFVKIMFVDEHDPRGSVKQVVRNVQNEGVVNYLGRVVSAGIEKSRERLAVAGHAPSMSGGSSTCSRVA